jgi:UDP-N-acetylmuramyl pentapeptide phosphotransferase/UDP-N-acetylglucosamine-1-phosphate transferase
VIVNPDANDALSRWLYRGVPLFIGIGIIAAFLLRFSFGLSLVRLAFPIAVLVGIQLLFYVGIYGTRQRYRRAGNLRPAALVTGIYGLCIVLAGMYYAGQLGIVSRRTFADNYVGFSVFMTVVTCIVVVVFLFAKPKPKS